MDNLPTRIHSSACIQSTYYTNETNVEDKSNLQLSQSLRINRKKHSYWWLKVDTISPSPVVVCKHTFKKKCLLKTCLHSHSKIRCANRETDHLKPTYLRRLTKKGNHIWPTHLTQTAIYEENFRKVDLVTVL